MSEFKIDHLTKVLVHQKHEIGEWIGFETRNKYQLMDHSQIPIGYAAEQQKGLLGFILRQYLGHWRKFDVYFFNNNRQIMFIAHHPFRWLFQRIEVKDEKGNYLGAIQKRFSFFTKRFDIEDKYGTVSLEVASPIWKIWTFDFTRNNISMAQVRKKWSGILSEAFTDKDNFEIQFNDLKLKYDEKILILISSIFIDLIYFEKKQ